MVHGYQASFDRAEVAAAPIPDSQDIGYDLWLADAAVVPGIGCLVVEDIRLGLGYTGRLAPVEESSLVVDTAAAYTDARHEGAADTHHPTSAVNGLA